MNTRLLAAIFLAILGFGLYHMFTVEPAVVTATTPLEPEISTDILGSWFFPLVPLGVLVAGLGYFGFMKNIKKWIPSTFLGLGIILIIFGIWTSEYYTAVERWSSNKEECVAGKTCNTEDLLCGPKKFVDGHVSSKTKPLRIWAELACSAFVPEKSAGIPVRISYNGERPITWVSGDAPKYDGTVKYVDVLSLNGKNVYIKISFPH